ncbi:hypothetical protein L6164_007564 [Bauhinia variegata]|uniref:Uncharacterized protein n=1 Tax=Bauhinia variegata TaxID=167791 RepID=A0ACB9PE56_BAUVA|nr:hypothetical protein L6164_007564 [Bauhinia variegata]
MESRWEARDGIWMRHEARIYAVVSSYAKLTQHNRKLNKNVSVSVMGNLSESESSRLFSLYLSILVRVRINNKSYLASLIPSSPPDSQPQ